MATIFHDPRYLQFAERYHADPLAFAINVCGLLPSGDQEELFYSITPENAKVTVASGTSTGKTAAFARIALWHLLCFPIAVYEGKLEIGSNTYIGAPRIKQVADGVWKELSDCYLAIANGAYSWLNDYYEITKTRVIVKGFADQWFITQVAMQQGQSIGVAGKHRYYQLIIIDEAAGVPDDHYDVIEGTQTQAGNRTLLASQGVKNAGRFYETHHNLSKPNGGSWAALRFNSERSPFVTKKWLKDRAEETGGRNSIEYKIRVLGLFAESSDSVLLTRTELESCFERKQIIADDEPYGIFVLGDVALGEYRDESVCLLAKVIGNEDLGMDARRVEYFALPICSNSMDEIMFAGELVGIFGSLSNATLYLDNGGVGHTVAKLIEASGVPVEKVNWGKPCFKKAYKERFFNQRACAMVRFRDAVRTGRVSFNFAMDKKIKEKVLLQGSRLPYHFAEAGGLRYVMDKKEDMRRQGIKSPDIIDAASFAFLDDAMYMVADNGNAGSAVSSTDLLLQQADDFFKDLE